jgi:hypothetical protein
VASLDVEAQELKNATLNLLLAGRRFLLALGQGARLSIEVGGETPLLLRVRDKTTNEEDAP